jgi:hypothetical protein
MIIFGIGNSPLFKAMVNKLKMASANYSPPSAQALGGAILDNNTAVHIADRDSRIASDSAGQYGTALVSDGATILRHSMLNPCSSFVSCGRRHYLLCARTAVTTLLVVGVKMQST